MKAQKKANKKREPWCQSPISYEPAEGFSDWMGSEEGQTAMEISDQVHEALAEVKLDVKRRKMIWPDGKVLDFPESAWRIERRYKFKDTSAVYDAMISWMEMDYEPCDINTDDANAMQRFEADIDRWIKAL